MTASVGKDHFGWNDTVKNGIGHGYDSLQLYDGLGSWNRSEASNGTEGAWVGEFDQYEAWFQRELPGEDPMATLDPLINDPNASVWNSWNSWYGAAYVYDETYHPTRWVGDRAVDFLESYASIDRASVPDRKPFLLKVSFHRPHSPYDPPRRLLDAVRAEDLAPPVVCDAATSINASSDNSGHGGGWCLRFRGEASDASGCGPSDPNAWCGLMPEANATLSRRAYAASVRFVDEQIGRVYDALVRGDLLERTFVLFTSDHGDGQMTHFHWRKGFPYEFSAHVPMLLRWPESFTAATISRGTRVRPPVVTELRDIFHTFVDIANISSAVKKMYGDRFNVTDGKSLLCLLSDPTGKESCAYEVNPGPWRSHIDLEHSTCYNESNHWNALTDGETKYVFRAFYGDEQLFDLRTDPEERREISQDPSYAEVLLMWRSKLVAQFVSEERGGGWVSNGTLVRREKGQTYSPNYPGGGGGGGGDVA